MTSNGITLPRKLARLVDHGLTHLNLSLDTLNPFTFELVTRRQGHEAVLRTLDLALAESRLQSVKLNVVVIKGLNENEVIDFVELTKERKLSVRFIEVSVVNSKLTILTLKLQNHKFMPFTGECDQFRCAARVTRSYQGILGKKIRWSLRLFSWKRSEDSIPLLRKLMMSSTTPLGLTKFLATEEASASLAVCLITSVAHATAFDSPPMVKSK